MSVYSYNWNNITKPPLSFFSILSKEHFWRLLLAISQLVTIHSDSVRQEMNVSFFTMAEGKLFKGFPCTDDCWLSEITVPECQFAAWGAYLDGEEVGAWEARNKDVSLKRPNASVKSEMKEKRSCQSHPSPAMNLNTALQKTQPSTSRFKSI